MLPGARSPYFVNQTTIEDDSLTLTHEYHQNPRHQSIHAGNLLHLIRLLQIFDY